MSSSLKPSISILLTLTTTPRAASKTLGLHLSSRWQKLSEMTRKFPEETIYRGRKLVNDCLDVGWEEELTAKGHKGTFGVIKVFYTWIVRITV